MFGVLNAKNIAFSISYVSALKAFTSKKIHYNQILQTLSLTSR